MSGRLLCEVKSKGKECNARSKRQVAVIPSWDRQLLAKKNKKRLFVVDNGVAAVAECEHSGSHALIVPRGDFHMRLEG